MDDSVHRAPNTPSRTQVKRVPRLSRRPHGHFDQRAVLHHDIDVAAIPVTCDALENLPPLSRVRDLARGRRQIRHDTTFEVDGEVGIRFEVGEPGTSRATRCPADVETAVDVVQDDLEPARLAALAPGGRLIDHVLRSCQRVPDLVIDRLGRWHSLFIRLGHRCLLC